MKKLGDFLERFIKLAQSSDDAKQAVVDSLVKNGIRYSGGVDTITVRGTVATLKLSPIQKSEIAMKQKKILATLAENPITKHITIVR